jgi:hypothetical protein
MSAINNEVREFITSICPYIIRDWNNLISSCMHEKIEYKSSYSSHSSTVGSLLPMLQDDASSPFKLESAILSKLIHSHTLTKSAIGILLSTNAIRLERVYYLLTPIVCTELSITNVYGPNRYPLNPPMELIRKISKSSNLIYTLPKWIESMSDEEYDVNGQIISSNELIPYFVGNRIGFQLSMRCIWNEHPSWYRLIGKIIEYVNSVGEYGDLENLKNTKDSKYLFEDNPGIN